MTSTREKIETGERPSLLAPQIVDGLVRRFTAEALDILAPPRSPTFMAAIDFECRRMNNLFLSVTPNDTYERGTWNTPDQLGTYIRQALRIDGEDRLAVRDAFMWYLDKVVDAVKRDESAEPLIAHLVNCLIGVAHQNPAPTAGS